MERAIAFWFIGFKKSQYEITLPTHPEEREIVSYTARPQRHQLAHILG